MHSPHSRGKSWEVHEMRGGLRHASIDRGNGERAHTKFPTLHHRVQRLWERWSVGYVWRKWVVKRLSRAPTLFRPIIRRPINVPDFLPFDFILPWKQRAVNPRNRLPATVKVVGHQQNEIEMSENEVYYKNRKINSKVLGNFRGYHRLAWSFLLQQRRQPTTEALADQTVVLLFRSLDEFPITRQKIALKQRSIATTIPPTENFGKLWDGFGAGPLWAPRS